MALTYLDTSALVKRYLQEVGAAWVAHLCRQEPIAMSLVTIPEVASALARRTRDGALSAQQRDMVFQVFLRDVRTYTVVGVDQAIAQQAASLLLSAPAPVRLRTLDALHVASAKRTFTRARRRGVATGSFVTADRALVDAATWAGLPTLNPENHA